MADEKEPVDDLSAVEIPDLKKKQEKERKKAGAAWGSSKPAGSWQGAVGGNGAGAAGSGARGVLGAAGEVGGGAAGNIGGFGGNLLSRGFFGALRAVFQGGGGIGGILTRAAQLASELVGAMTATTAGKMAVAAAVAVAVGIAAILAARLLGGAGGKGGPELAGMKSSIQIDKGGRSGLDMTRSGDTKLAQPAAPKPKEEPKQEVAEKAQEAPPAENAGGDGMGVQEGVGSTGPTDRMAHNLSGAQLTSGLGGSFQNTPFANVSAPKFPGLTKNKVIGFGKGDRKGTGGRLMARNVNANRNMNLRGLRSSRALGQLRGMGSQVGNIMQKAGETSSAEATTQFEGTTNSGGTAPTGPTSGPTGVEGGGGGPGTTGGPGIDTPTNTPDYCTQQGGNWDAENQTCTFDTSHINTTPWQGKVAEAKSKLEEIKSLLNDIMYLWIAALALFALAAALWCSGGPAFLAAGLALVAIIVVKAMKIHRLGGELKDIGNEINAMPGGKPQGDIFIDFGDQAQTAAWVAAGVPIIGAAIYEGIVSSALDKINAVEAQLKPQE